MTAMAMERARWKASAHVPTTGLAATAPSTCLAAALLGRVSLHEGAFLPTDLHDLTPLPHLKESIVKSFFYL